MRYTYWKTNLTPVPENCWKLIGLEGAERRSDKASHAFKQIIEQLKMNTGGTTDYSTKRARKIRGCKDCLYHSLSTQDKPPVIYGHLGTSQVEIATQLYEDVSKILLMAIT